MKLNEKVKQYRKIFGLTQDELAEILCVSRQVVTKWESDNGMPDIGNLKSLADLFCVSVDFLLDDEKNIDYPIIKENYTLEKNNYSNRYDYAVSYLKARYNDNASIYALTQTENEEKNIISKIFSFITIGVSDISSIVQWFGDLAIWFAVEKANQKYLVKVTKECIETREISNLIDFDKFTYEKKKFIKVEKL